MPIGRVYINFGQDYEKHPTFYNFDELISAVAHSVNSIDNELLVRTVGDRKFVYLARTKKYIAKEATRFIRSLERVPGRDHMALYVSKRQINRLIRVCEHKGHHLSCYSLVVLHIIYTLLNEGDRDDTRINLCALSTLIYDLANTYGEHNHNDLVQFIIDCHRPIGDEFSNERECELKDFPAIHRWQNN